MVRMKKSKRRPLKERKIRRKFALKKAKVVGLQLAKPFQTGAVLPTVSPRYRPVIMVTGRKSFEFVNLKMTKAQLKTLERRERLALKRLKRKKRRLK